ncbi:MULTISPECIES: peptidase [unclassified Streptomyces]|uniref:peptidase n=1 Tax=unclassified Streptomyces TaxID=2593676 RepID=UPI002E259A47
MVAGATSQASATLRTYPIAPGAILHVRSGPGVHFSIVRDLPEGSSVPIYCQCPGDTVSGYYGTTNIWDNISNGQFVSDAYVHTGSDGYVAPACS